MSVTAEQLQSAKEALQTAQGDRLRADRILSKDGWTDQVLRKRALDEAEANVSTDRESTPREVADAVIEEAKTVEPVNAILQAALRCVEIGWFVFALEERGKRPDGELAPHGFNSSTNDANAVRAIFSKRPNANYGIDLGRSNLTVLDFDKGMPAGLELPSTLQVSTSRGVHVYFQGVSKQGDLHVGGQHVGEIKSAGGYVLGPGCVHPDGPIYTVVLRAPVAPTPSALIERLRPAKGKGKEETTRNERGLVPHGQIHPWMLKQAGRLRQSGLTQDEIEPVLLRLVHENCEPPIDEAKVEAMAKSICIYEQGEGDTSVKLVQHLNPPSVPAVQTTAAAEDGPDVIVENGITYAIIPHGDGFRRVALDTSTVCARPTFPEWLMKDTSIYEGLVRPAVETSSKYAEFIFMPAVQAVMNYLSFNVTVDMQPSNMNLFLGLISPYGKFFKSTSCALAHEYIKAMELLCTTGKNASNKVVVAQAGSSEGFGLLMKSMSAKHAIMFNDELGKLVAKAGIEKSSFSSDMLSWYGSADFGNRVKNEAHSFDFPPGSYTFGWLWCTTDRNFNHYWPKLAGISSGIQDRMFFLVSPEKPRPIVPYRDPELATGAKKTRALIDRAVAQGRFRVVDFEYEKHVDGVDDPRSLEMLFKFALYFAVDLGLDSIDETCMERARALVDCRNQAAKFLEPIEAENAEGRLMQEILRELRQNGGIMAHRDLYRNLNASRAGRTWDVAYRLLKEAGTQAIVEFYAGQTPGKRKTRMVAIKIDDEDLPE